MNEGKKPQVFTNATRVRWIAVDGEYDTYMPPMNLIEKSAAEIRDSTLRCMQQILKANGSMTYKEFLVNLDGCGMTEDQLGELGE